MIFLKKTEIFICQNKYQYFKFDFSAPPPPPQISSTKSGTLARVRASNPATNYMDRQGSIPGTLLLALPSGWRLKAWVSVKKVICPVERTCLTLVASTSLQSLQFGSCIAAHELMVQLMTRRRPFFTERPSNAAKCTDNFRKPFDHFFIQNRGICCCLFNTIQVSTISSTTCNIFSTSRRFVLLCCCSRTIFVVHCISLSIPALTAQN